MVETVANAHPDRVAGDGAGAFSPTVLNVLDVRS